MSWGAVPQEWDKGKSWSNRNRALKSIVEENDTEMMCVFSDALLELQVEKEALGGEVSEFIVARKKRIDWEWFTYKWGLSQNRWG